MIVIQAFYSTCRRKVWSAREVERNGDQMEFDCRPSFWRAVVYGPLCDIMTPALQVRCWLDTWLLLTITRKRLRRLAQSNFSDRGLKA